jgi:hypothetical protein
VRKSSDKALSLPQLDVLAIYKLSRFVGRFSIVSTFDELAGGNVSVGTDEIDAIVGHGHPLFGAISFKHKRIKRRRPKDARGRLRRGRGFGFPPIPGRILSSVARKFGPIGCQSSIVQSRPTAAGAEFVFLVAISAARRKAATASSSTAKCSASP